MWESFLLDWLQQFDLTSLGDLSELDWADIATYSTVAIAISTTLWSSFKRFFQSLWDKVEGILGFAVSTLVVFSLWYSLLRVHVSVSFNLDKELFDNFLQLSALSFTPYYLIRYKLLAGVLLVIARTVELVTDLVVFSWFPEKAEQNRAKWGDRVRRAYQAGQASMSDFFKTGFSAAQEAQLPFGLGDSSHQNEQPSDAH
ncbi:MAG: hypothetical protein F6K35_51005 [Okeania sp. SIO2H7]|nr:hypothetical protein [Okeania sp. SIO2H7]